MRPWYTVNVNHLQEYIRAVSNIPKADPEIQRPAFPFVTISRQAGAGGHSLAQAIVQELEKQKDVPLFQGWQVLDQDLCRQLMEDPDLKVCKEWLLTERFERESIDYLSQIIVGTSPQSAVYHKIAKLIRRFAACGKVIVVGRAGSLLTRDFPMGIHMRLVAPKTQRIHNMMRLFHLREGEAEMQVEEQDASRARLVKVYFNGKDIADPLLYDMVWNTQAVAIPTIARCTVSLIQERATREKVAAASCTMEKS